MRRGHPVPAGGIRMRLAAELQSSQRLPVALLVTLSLAVTSLGLSGTAFA